MTSYALILVLSAACIHASWNYLTKLVAGGASFLWLFSMFSALIYMPLAIAVLLIQQPDLGSTELWFCLLSAIIHLGYFMLLQRGYALGDLSLVYPLARATGPLLATIAAIIIFAERPSTPAIAGGALIIAGVFFLTGGHKPQQRSKKITQSILFGIATGVLIGGYTLIDSYTVSILLVPPLLLDYCSTLSRCVILAPYAQRNWSEVVQVWRQHKIIILAVAVLAPLSYILVLTALVFTPVSYVAPAREISVLIVVLLGTRLLGEGHMPSRLAWGSVILLGMVLLTTN